MRQEAYFCTVKELDELGKNNIPRQLISHTHLIYSSPATLAFNSPGAEGFGVKRAGLAVPDSVMLDEIKTHAFEPLRPDLAAKLREGDLIVAGSNFGCGSSREQAAEVLVANGVHCVIAKSFARIFFRNAINNGILLLECQDLADHVKEGDIIHTSFT